MVGGLRAAGAIVIGTTTMPEVRPVRVHRSAAFGVTRNPLGHQPLPGGSSGGTAIATGVFIGLGADGGGSIRIPAACTGLVRAQRSPRAVPAPPD